MLYLNFAILSLCELPQNRYFYVYLCDVDLNGLKYEQQDLPYRGAEFWELDCCSQTANDYLYL